MKRRQIEGKENRQRDLRERTAEERRRGPDGDEEPKLPDMQSRSGELP